LLHFFLQVDLLSVSSGTSNVTLPAGPGTVRASPRPNREYGLFPQVGDVIGLDGGDSGRPQCGATNFS